MNVLHIIIIKLLLVSSQARHPGGAKAKVLSTLMLPVATLGAI